MNSKSNTARLKPQKEAKVFVDHAGALEDILSSIPPKREKPPPKVKEQPVFDDNPATLRRERKLIENALTAKAMQRNVEKSLMRAVSKQDAAFPVMLADVGAATEFLDIIDRDLNLHEETKKNKVRRQFEDWNTNVHGAIQQNIAKTINKMDNKELNRQKNEDYEKFLNITNKKPAIFRDIIIESEYDPLEPNRRCIVGRTGRLKDPVKVDAQKAEAEASMLGTKPIKKKLGKDTLSVEMWASGKIESTPYGMFAKLMDDSAGGDKSKKAKATKSNVTFDDFGYKSGKEALDPEMPRGKRIYPRTIYADPSRVFGHLPPNVEKELAAIKPPVNTSYLSDAKIV